jgi:translation initiation factor 2 subunit 3
MFKKIILHQATINIGTIGHVAHGKSTVIKSITNVQTIRFKNELARNITIKLGYANAKIFKCKNIHCPGPGCFKSTCSGKIKKFFCEQCHYDMQLIKHISFVDCPGHEILMATMLNGASIMDTALLIIAGNEKCPQPQTLEHLAAIEIMKMKNLIILQNKVDLISKEKALKNFNEIKHLKKKKSLEKSIIIPISAQRKFNLDILVEILAKNIKLPPRNLTSSLNFIIVRSFDINKPGCLIENMEGGVVGGSLIKGIIILGQNIEIRPGILCKMKKGEVICFPIKTFVCSLNAEKNILQYAIPGGLIGIKTKIDPTLTRSDRLCGQSLGDIYHLPCIYQKIFVFYKLFKRLLGISNEVFKINPLILNEIIMINIGSFSTGGKIIKKKNNIIELYLTSPICCELDCKLAISRRIEKHWRLIGWGKIKKGISFLITKN